MLMNLFWSFGIWEKNIFLHRLYKYVKRKAFICKTIINKLNNKQTAAFIDFEILAQRQVEVLQVQVQVNLMKKQNLIKIQNSKSPTRFL